MIIQNMMKILGLKNNVYVLCLLFWISGAVCDAWAHDGRSRQPTVVFLISQDPDNYKADQTIPVFAEWLATQSGWKVTVLQSQGPRTRAGFEDLERIQEADLVVVFARRLALTPGQNQVIRSYLASGRPIVGIRTANHAFSVLDQDLSDGYVAWWEFASQVMGCVNKGYGPVGPGTEVSVVAESDSILKGVQPLNWHSSGNLYYVELTDRAQSRVLIEGKVDGVLMPVAWTRTVGQSRVFYTSMGHPDDFELPQFKTLLVNAMRWAMKLK